MAETYTFRRARLVNKKRLCIIWDAGAARSGIPTVDATKFSITASGGAVGTTLTSADQILSVSGTIGSASAFLPPAYTSVDGDVSSQLVQWVFLDRIIAGDETVTITLAAGFNSDDTNTSEAVTDQAVQVRTFCDSDGVILESTLPDRVGCGDRTKLDPSTVSPTLYIRAEDAAGVGDGNAVGAFTATTGGTITPSGTVTYRADGVASSSIIGATSCPIIDMASGATLTSTAALPTSTSDFTVIAIYALASNAANFVTAGAPFKQSWTFPGSIARNFRNVNDSASIANAGGRYLGGTNNHKRLAVSAASYSHSNTRNRVYGYGGVYLSAATVTTTQDHSAAITLTASGGGIHLCALLVVPSELTTAQVRQIAATFDDDYNTTGLSYYIDPVSGNDSNSGLSAAAPRLTPPAYSNNDPITYGAGDRILYKFGTEIAEHVILTSTVYPTTYAYSSQFPIVVGGYGTRSDGRFQIVRRSAATGSFSNDSTNAHALFFGIETYSERRDPSHANYVGFATASTETTGGTGLGLQVDLEDSRLYYDLDGDPAFHMVHDCAYRYIGGKGISDNGGGNTDERWTVISNCLFDTIWYGQSSTDASGDRPSGVFMSNSSVLCIAENLTHRAGWNPDIASIGDWSGGSRTFTSECVAVYDSGTDTTTITGTGQFTNFLFTGGAGDAVGPLLLIVKRTSDATEHTVSIAGKTSNNEIVVNGNPFSLADEGSVSDCLCHGGSPAAADGRNHGFYITSAGEGGSVRAATLNVENIHLRPADHGSQMRGGGYLINNVVIDAAIGGYVSGTSISIIRGNYVEGGRRTQGAGTANGPRAWGFYANMGSNDQYFSSMRENICNLGYEDDLVAFAPTVAGTTFALQMAKGTTTVKTEMVNNTIPRGARTLISKNGSGTLDSGDDILRNIVQQPTADPDAVTETILSGSGLATANVGYNIWYHPDGAAGTRWNNATETLAQWITTTGATGEQAKQVTFFNGDADIAEYYSTLSGGSDSKSAFMAAAVAAYETNTLTGFTASEILAWMRTQYRPTNLDLSEGGGTYLPGAVALESGTSAPTVNTPTSTSIGTTTATLGGTIDSAGSGTISERGVVWAETATNADPEIGGTGVTKVAGTGTSTGAFTVGVTGLTAETGYSFKAYAISDDGTGYSAADTFTTEAEAPEEEAPTVTTPTSASITATTATLGGNVTSDGGATVTERGIVIAPTATNADPEIGGTGVTKLTTTGTTGVFTLSATGLTAETGYSFKAFATNSVGTTYTSVDTFTTLEASSGPPPRSGSLGARSLRARANALRRRR